MVGIIFDGNIQSLPWNFVYDDTRAAPSRWIRAASSKRSARSTAPQPLADELLNGHRTKAAAAN